LKSNDKFLKSLKTKTKFLKGLKNKDKFLKSLKIRDKASISSLAGKFETEIEGDRKMSSGSLP